MCTFSRTVWERHVKAKFVVLTTENGARLELTANHYLYVDGRLVAARSARVGQVLRTAKGESKIATIEEEWNAGLFAPKTLSGEVMVDGVLASSYTDFLPPALTHSMLLPVRMMYKVAPTVVESISYGPPEWLEHVMVNARDMFR